MQQTSREVIRNTIDFTGPDRLGIEFPEPYGTDFFHAWMTPSPDWRPWGKGATDEWGAVWENIGICGLGEVKEFPLKSWDDLPALNIPDIREERRFEEVRTARAKAPDKFLMGYGVSLYERVHFLRGLENTWCDIYTDPGKLGALIDVMVGMNLYAIDEHAKAGCDAYSMCDDWGLQDRLMISPDKWRELWKPRYATVFARAHERGMRTFMHSCGYTLDILDDLIEAGLDVIQLDQQANMGVETLGERFGGRITFFCPVDIQAVLPKGDYDEIRAYCRQLMTAFASPKGGFLAKWYGDTTGAGHRMDAVNVMCEEFLKISKEIYP
ncbi:MAG: hypothetical protein FWF84_05670 [Kiritimatiellaeota bacterium]|nr:hypothetical protein [Kiritimatiellota bacterium]